MIGEKSIIFINKAQISVLYAVWTVSRPVRQTNWDMKRFFFYFSFFIFNSTSSSFYRVHSLAEWFIVLATYAKRRNWDHVDIRFPFVILFTWPQARRRVWLAKLPRTRLPVCSLRAITTAPGTRGCHSTIFRPITTIIRWNIKKVGKNQSGKTESWNQRQ